MKINERKIKEIIEKALQYLQIEEGVEISILLADDKIIRELNKKYRGIDEPTDVLAFSLQEGKVKFPEVEENRPLGDIIISTETARRQAEILNHKEEEEITLLVIHGLLHLLGYDHEEEQDNKLMRQKERELLNLFGFSADL